MLTPANTATPGVKSLSRGVSDVTPLTTSDGVGGGCVLRSGMTMGQMTSGSEICRLSVQLQQRNIHFHVLVQRTYSTQLLILATEPRKHPQKLLPVCISEYTYVKSLMVAATA